MSGGTRQKLEGAHKLIQNMNKSLEHEKLQANCVDIDAYHRSQQISIPCRLIDMLWVLLDRVHAHVTLAIDTDSGRECSVIASAIPESVGDFAYLLTV